MIHPDVLSQALRAQAKKRFDPEGEDYDEETAKMLIQKYPLTTPKPTKYMGDELGNEDAFQRWVYHKDLADYVVHGASFNPETGMLLKGKKHKTFHLTQQTEDKLGNEIYWNPKVKRYFSRNKK
ncbi:MAG TPA: hypothetical protein VMV86_04130 [Methanosarcinales archaeon]|nr:hypothetical protein [Methanosarcinales archaeon]